MIRVYNFEDNLLFRSINITVLKYFPLLNGPKNPCIFNFYIQVFSFPLLFLAVASHFFCTSSSSIAAIFLSSNDVFLISCGLGNWQLSLFELYILLKMNSKWMPIGFSSQLHTPPSKFYCMDFGTFLLTVKKPILLDCSLCCVQRNCI